MSLCQLDVNLTISFFKIALFLANVNFFNKRSPSQCLPPDFSRLSISTGSSDEFLFNMADISNCSLPQQILSLSENVFICQLVKLNLNSFL